MIDARGWLIRAPLALGLVLIPSIFADFTANAADLVKTDSDNGVTLWVDREVKDFTFNPEWKLIRVKVRFHDETESLQTYVVDFIHNRSALVEVDGSPVPIGKWRWMPDVPGRR